ncbi:hypothetical protein ACWF8U_10740 [Streptomyces olivaceus]
MDAPGRRTPRCSRSTGRPARRITRAVQYAGRLLCWSLAAGMATAAIQLLFAPRADWWAFCWPLPWYLTCLSALAWAVLRAREKGSQGPPDEEPLPDPWDRAA